MDISLLPNTVLEQANARQMSIRPMKLQKLMYFSCGLYAASCGETPKWLLPLRAPFLAYPYGPVVEEVYDYFRKYGGNYIREYMHNGKAFADAKRRVYDVLDIVFDRWGNKDDASLSRITHKSGSPWNEVWKEKPYGEIAPFKIYEYYRKEYPEIATDV